MPVSGSRDGRGGAARHRSWGLKVPCPQKPLSLSTWDGRPQGSQPGAVSGPCWFQGPENRGTPGGLIPTPSLAQLALPHLRRSRGNIINISSLVGAVGQLQGVPYAATKGAVTALTKALALDESQYGVRVNCISPGNIWTPLWQELAALAPDPRAAIREGAMAQPLGRMGQPAEVGAAAVFLASEASFCTGLELFVTGGAELGYGCKAGPSTPVEVPDLSS
ncbi:17-beta-hydroxysteroid dehydrogenase 14 isoform X3 [Oryctolagus cuniculus]|uniref:17-beta-hydroxysteroid dehydrogenase 14 isoform X3 n=1 Tax=Oryctolagus cuniculus TaxID=9986 RepID=UPI0038796DD7